MSVFVEAKEVKFEGARFLDCRFDLMNAASGEEQFTAGHIEGALYVHLDRDVSDMTKKDGRHPMPDKSALVELFERLGLQLNDTVYCYDNGAEPFAARTYWMLTYAGFEQVYIVNGGYEALVEAGMPVSAEVVAYPRTSITPNWKETIFAARPDVLAISTGKEDAVLVDARAAKRYAGEFEPLDPIAGHIPGAINFDWEQLKDGRSLHVTDALQTTVPKDKPVVVYCGSGVTASPLYATLKEAGYEDVRLYVGSYSDWITEHDVAKK